MQTAYYSTSDLRDRYRCSSRTLFRRMQRKTNPLPSPCIKHTGSHNLWDADDIAQWEMRERLRTKGASPAPATMAGAAP